MSKGLYLYPIWIRIWHITNAILFLILIITGISLQFSGMEEPFVLVSFKSAVSWHNTAAFILLLSYIVFIIGNAVTGNIRHYRNRSTTLMQDLIVQFNYYSRDMFRGVPHPFPVTADSKFNPLQRFTYLLAMYAGMPLLILSGTLLFFPELLPRQIFGISGLLINDMVHIITGFLLSIFMVVHIYTCTLGGKPSTLFKSMIDGYHHDEH
jgi:thiosulfate reductase cytochrome b subunit